MLCDNEFVAFQSFDNFLASFLGQRAGHIRQALNQRDATVFKEAFVDFVKEEAQTTYDAGMLESDPDANVVIFGLNRHELFPYTGFAMPRRALRHDAELLRHELNCNAVRCSHYPQSAAFLDACDELGLLVWEELPGWSYIGNDAYWASGGK